MRLLPREEALFSSAGSENQRPLLLREVEELEDNPVDLRQISGGDGQFAEAGENVTLTYRSGAQSGIIAVETAGVSGRLFLEGEYKDILTERLLSGNIELAPYEVLMLNQV